MNILRKFKFLFIAAFAVLFSISVASCKKDETPVTDDTEQKEDETPRTGIADDDPSFTSAKANVSESGFNFDTARLSSIDIDITNAKTVFYLGEEFNCNGVVVKANFLNSENKVESYTTTDFTIDSSEVDMYNMGTYPVEISYRYKATIYEKVYNIKVISSELAVSGEEYIGGIDVKYNNKIDYTMNLGEAFDASTSKFTVVQHVFCNEEEVSYKTVPSSKYSTDGSTQIKIDASSVNPNVRGDYLVKVEYTPDEIYIGTTPISYVVKAFIIIHVSDPIVKLEFKEGTKTYSATVGSFDYSDWKFQVTRKNSGVAIVNYNEDDFVVEEIVPFITGPQTAIVKYLDAPTAVRVDLTVTESQTYNIVTGSIYELTYDEAMEANICTGEVWSYSISTSASDEALDSSGIFKINKPAKYETDRFNDTKKLSKDYYGSLYFGPRITIKGTDSYVSVKMDNPGLLVIYAASTGETVRDINVYSDKNLGGTEVGTLYTPDVKQQICQYLFTVTEAGTYYIQSFEGGIYVHGIVVAVAK